MYPEFADRCAVDLVHDLTYNLRDGYVEPEDENETIAPAITLPSIVEETTDEEEDDRNDDNDDDDDVTEGDELDDERIPSSTNKMAAGYTPTRRRRCSSEVVGAGGRSVTKASSFEEGTEEGNSADGYENDNCDDDVEGCSETEDIRFGSTPSAGGATCSIPLLGSPPGSSTASRGGQVQQRQGGESTSRSSMQGGDQGSLPLTNNCTTPNSDDRFVVRLMRLGTKIVTDLVDSRLNCFVVCCFSTA